MPDYVFTIGEWVSKFVTFFADLFTAILGSAGIWALIFHRQKAKLFFKLVLSGFVNERIKRIKETLGKLESLNYDDKANRPEIIALLGQTLGQIKSLTEHEPIRQTHADISDLIDNKARISEATKRRVVYELHAALDTVSFEAMQTLLEERK